MTAKIVAEQRRLAAQRREAHPRQAPARAPVRAPARLLESDLKILKEESVTEHLK